VLGGDSIDLPTVRALHAVYPHRAVVVLTNSAAVANKARAAGAATLPTKATSKQIAALVSQLDK
jgi:hypothetical protein